MDPVKVGDLVGRCSTLAALLEVSAYPKPGNVHRLRDYPYTQYEHFLAGSVASEPYMRGLAFKASLISKGNGEWSYLGLGDAVLGATEDMLLWQSGGNVHLGVILLFAPLAAAAGSSLHKEKVNILHLRKSLQEIIKNSTSKDTIGIFKAINLAMSREHLGAVEELDVTDTSSQTKIQSEDLKPIEVFSLCAERDSICSEWVTGFKIIFEEGYPNLNRTLGEGLNINDSTVTTFLEMLSTHPDSLIQRKNGYNKAREISNTARRVLDAGGVNTTQGKELLYEMDEELSVEGSMNPGTTADLTAASLFVLLLSGWRP